MFGNPVISETLWGFVAQDVIKSGGEWISSIEVENAAMAHPHVWRSLHPQHVLLHPGSSN